MESAFALNFIPQLKSRLGGLILRGKELLKSLFLWPHFSLLAHFQSQNGGSGFDKTKDHRHWWSFGIHVGPVNKGRRL